MTATPQASTTVASVTTVLVVDDDPDVRTTLCKLLSLEGFSVESAENGCDAIDRQTRSPADIVITDLFMPDADGFELIQALHKQFPAVKVIALSGARPAYLRMAALIGVDAVLEKPVDYEKLYRTLRSLRR